MSRNNSSNKKNKPYLKNIKMVSDKFTLDSVKRHRIYLSLKSVAYMAGPEKWRTLHGFIFSRFEKYDFSKEQ